MCLYVQIDENFIKTNQKYRKIQKIDVQIMCSPAAQIHVYKATEKHEFEF